MGTIYFDVSHFYNDITPGKISMNYENLFSKDKGLGESKFSTNSNSTLFITCTNSERDSTNSEYKCFSKMNRLISLLDRGRGSKGGQKTKLGIYIFL